uniref:serine protease 55 isoform X2 n=1 Tax=Ciona intestinalis TaxID=7719 RepID=UPI000EF52D67|nr:serine protease 55 isoform X2 [Ciona intestinalis]|eukprot:XP_026691014.1 serine protease 55 isoform X2 [Ciona intestinalis]
MCKTTMFLVLWVILGVESSTGTNISPNDLTCVDQFSWCPNFEIQCSTVPLIRSWCKKTCSICSTEECRVLNCSQSCAQSNGTGNYKCGCYSGFRLNPDNQTCSDINECIENPSLCNLPGTTCLNHVGSYICGPCSSIQGYWNYYRRNECCKFRQDNCGAATSFSQWPSAVYIQIGEDKSCTGSLISSKWVVAAAHCFENSSQSNISVIMGNENVGHFNVHEQTCNVIQVTIHEHYNYPYNNFALLHLGCPVIESSYILPVCLPNGEETAVGEKCWGLGYQKLPNSQGHILQAVSQPIASIETCQGQVNVSINNSMIYGGHVTETYKGPLLCQRCNSCSWYLAGMHSFGSEMNHTNGVYTRITTLENWITEHTAVRSTRQPCVHATWTLWGAWSRCESCFKGFRNRTRSCENPGDLGCPGYPIHQELCQPNNCQS